MSIQNTISYRTSCKYNRESKEHKFGKLQKTVKCLSIIDLDVWQTWFMPLHHNYSALTEL